LVGVGEQAQSIFFCLGGVIMGLGVPFFAGPGDDHSLRLFIESQGLLLIPMRVDLDPALVTDARRYAAWFISFIPLMELHPYGKLPRVNCATDPLIELQRSYYDPPLLVAGRLYWSDDVREFRELTKPYFVRVAEWIQKHWQKREEDDFFIGPDALRLVSEEGAKLVYFPPDVQVEIVPVPYKSR
jgi:hypothetical protein